MLLHLQVCEDWLSRTRGTLLALSAAAGAQQHTVYHGMARLQELLATLKTLTAHYQAQQQQLHQQQQQHDREQDKAREQATSSSSTAAAASAAAAAAITGLAGSGQQTDRKGRQGRQGRQAKGQQQQQQEPELAKLKTKQAPAADSQAGSSVPPVLPEQQKALSQAFQAAVLRLAAPVLSTLVLLVDALIQTHEASTISGLQQWIHSSFHPVWRAVSRFYALDLSLDAAGVGGSSVAESQQDWGFGAGAAAAAGTAAPQPQSTMMLLTWLQGAAAQAEGRYEAAMQLHAAFLASEACAVPLGACLRGFVVEQLATCYEAVGDWQGLAGLSSIGGASRQQQQQPVVGAQHWILGGAAGVAALQQWQLATASTTAPLVQQQQQYGARQRLGVDERLLDASSVGQLPGLSAAGQVIMNAVATLQALSNKGSSGKGVGQQQPDVRSGQGKHHRRGSAPAARHGQQQQQQQLGTVLAEVQAQLQQLSSNPLFIMHASTGGSNGGSRQAKQWLQLSLLQLLEGALSAGLQQQQQPDQQQQQGPDLPAAIGHLLQTLADTGRPAGSRCWDRALRCDGQLAASCFEEVGCAMPLVQVGSPAAALTAHNVVGHGG